MDAIDKRSSKYKDGVYLYAHARLIYILSCIKYLSDIDLWIENRKRTMYKESYFCKDVAELKA
jgi:hypothetical protein